MNQSLQVPMDHQDLNLRLLKTEERYAQLLAEHEELQARAFALIWYLPAQIKVAELQAERQRMWDVIKRANRADDNAAAGQKWHSAWNRLLDTVRQIERDLEPAIKVRLGGNDFRDASTLPQSAVGSSPSDVAGSQPPGAAGQEGDRSDQPVALTQPPVPEETPVP